MIMLLLVCHYWNGKHSNSACKWKISKLYTLYKVLKSTAHLRLNIPTKDSSDEVGTLGCAEIEYSAPLQAL